MKDRIYIFALLGAVLIGSALLYQGCSREVPNHTKVNGKNINHGTEVYEIEFDGQKYIVVETFRGIGVTKK